MSRRRSRFDDGPRSSSRSPAPRHARRSASPGQRDRKDRTESARRDDKPADSMSPPPRTDSARSGVDEEAAAAAKKKAAEAAARLSAILKGKPSTPASLVPAVRPQASVSRVVNVPNQDVDENGDFIKDIEVNDLRNRYLLIKDATIQEIRDKTGAEVTVCGKYWPDKSMATERDPPMYLHIASKVKTKVEAAVGMANKLINQDLGPLVDERRFRRRDDFERDEYGRRKWPEEKVPVNIQTVRNFHLRAAVVGQGGANVKYVQQETRTRIQVKGQGSGFEESNTGRESDEPMYMHITGPDQAEVVRARGMIEDLLVSVRQQYEEYKREHNIADDPVPDRRDGRHEVARLGDNGRINHGEYDAHRKSSFHDSPGHQGSPSYGYPQSLPPPPPPSSTVYRQAPPPPPPPAAPGQYGNAPPPGHGSSSHGPPPPPSGRSGPPDSGARPPPPPPPPSGQRAPFAYSSSSSNY